MFKFDLNQTVYYLGPRGVYEAPVLARMQCENLNPGWASTSEQRELYTPWGEAGTYYRTCHGIVPETACFASREELGQAIANGDARNNHLT
jgi:hypothetical protein